MDEPISFESTTKKPDQVGASSVITALQLGSMSSAEMALARWSKGLFRDMTGDHLSKDPSIGGEHYSLEIFEHKVALYIADAQVISRLERARIGFFEHICNRIFSCQTAVQWSAVVTKIQENTTGRFVFSFRTELHLA